MSTRLLQLLTRSQIAPPSGAVAAGAGEVVVGCKWRATAAERVAVEAVVEAGSEQLLHVAAVVALKRGAAAIPLAAADDRIAG